MLTNKKWYLIIWWDTSRFSKVSEIEAQIKINVEMQQFIRLFKMKTNFSFWMQINIFHKKNFEISVVF